MDSDGPSLAEAVRWRLLYCSDHLEALTLGSLQHVPTAVLLCLVGVMANLAATAGIGNTFSLTAAEWSSAGNGRGRCGSLGGKNGAARGRLTQDGHNGLPTGRILHI